MQLRNAILIALAFDATPAEVDAAHDAIDRQFGGASVAPEVLVSAQIDSATGNINTTGTGQPITAPSHEVAANVPVIRAVTDNPDCDINGLPWDERIHSSNHRKDSKGGWWAKRNVDPALKASVEAELRATLGAAPVTTAPVIAPAAVIAPPALPGAGLPPMPGAALPDPAYAALVALIAQNTNSVANPAGRLTDDWVKQVLTHFGVAEGNLQNLAHAPQLVPQIAEYISGVLAG